MVSTSTLRSVSAIETLIIESPFYIDGLFLERHKLFTSSLKKLCISTAGSEEKNGNLSAKNNLWLLLFVPSLQEAVLKLDLDIDDSQFLLEVGDTIDGLPRVSKLSLDISFVWDASTSKTWWGLQEESYRHSAQGNQKTFAVSQLLRCVNTNQLVSLEIVGNLQPQRKGDSTLLLPECLTILQQSFSSLLHLRLFGMVRRGERLSDDFLSSFKFMKMLTLDGGSVRGLHCGGSKLMVPSSLEVVWFPISAGEGSEDDLLQFIDFMSSDLPKMREMVLPMAPILAGSKRERLEKAEIFTSGRVSLRKFEDGETSE